MVDHKNHTTDFFQRTKRKTTYKMQKMHFHDKHELYYLESGKTKYFIGNEIFLLDAGDFVFVPAGTFHKTYNEELPNTERILLTFDDDFAGSDSEKYINELKSNKFVRLSHDKLYKIKDIFRKIEHEDRIRNTDYDKLEQLYLRELLILISRYRSKDNLTRLNQSYQIAQNAAKYISQNYNSDLSLDFLSRKYAVSPAYFSKLFKIVTGVGLNEYINISRISAAEKLLLNSNMSITAIATECGFNDSNYFAAVFKKLKGITPKKYSIQNKPD